MDRFFFVPPEFFLSDGFVEFPPDEANHAFKVLRLHSGAIVSVVDGQGACVKVQVEQCDGLLPCRRIRVSRPGS